MAKRQISFRNKNTSQQHQKQQLHLQKSKGGTTKKIVGGITKRFVKPKIQDARQKLIQKKRKNLVDARDVLAQIAKTQDARTKLNKLRQNKGAVGTSNSNLVKAIGTNIVRKTDSNGKVSLMTNKTKGGLNFAIQKELGLVNPQSKKTFTRRLTPRPILRAPILKEIELPEMEQMTRYDPTLYKWPKPASQLIGALGARRMLNEGWQNFAINKSFRPAQNYIDLDAIEDDCEMPLVSSTPLKKHTISLQGSSRVSNIHSRLDGVPMEQESHGILSQSAATKTKVVVPAGHRIVVSNLQASVTQDDVKELFEDIGLLLAARLVRPGVAEVIYKNLKDAQKAVDTYHNRQLDGQPMKCLLVNKRPINNPTAPPLLHLDQGKAVQAAVVQASSSNKLVPDLSTIHKVLFQRN